MPRDTPYAGVASIFRSELSAGRPPQVFEDGGQTRDFVHVTDVARANVLALTRPNLGSGPVNVASGVPHTVLDLARAVCASQGDATSPALEPVVTGRWRLGDVRHVVASAQRALDALGFEAEIGFAEGMADFAVGPMGDNSAT
jgi:dTDP-L-rhamnose 4-epimerase